MDTSTNQDHRQSKVLRALGFCGADDSVDPKLLKLLSSSYPLVEFGILFRPDKEGTPRYASQAWVQRLSKLYSDESNLKLAAHLCGSIVNDLLNGNDGLLNQLTQWGFKRVQINATARNGVDTTHLGKRVPTLHQIIQNHSSLEFILQKSEETRPLWEGFLALPSWPSNLSMLVDESKGTGTPYTPGSWTPATDQYPVGYAGGIGPDNISQALHDLQVAANGHSVWIDMESSLRSTLNGNDVFDIHKCFQVIQAVVKAGWMPDPPQLQIAATEASSNETAADAPPSPKRLRRDASTGAGLSFSVSQIQAEDIEPQQDAPRDKPSQQEEEVPRPSKRCRRVASTGADLSFSVNQIQALDSEPEDEIPKDKPSATS